MRALFVLLVFVSSACFAQGSTTEPDCQTLLDYSVEGTALSIKTGQEQDWNKAFSYDEFVFESLIKALSYCADQPEQLKTAQGYLADHKEVSKQLECSFHALAAKDHLQLGQSALIADLYKDAEYFTDWGIFYLNEAITRCSFDPKRVAILLQTQSQAIHQLELIDELILTQTIQNGH